MGLVTPRQLLPWRLIFIGMLCAMLPDLDVAAFHFQIPYASPFGHRGWTHSIMFALFMAGLVGILEKYRTQANPLRIAILFVFIATLSHGVLDALTNGGLGIAFFWPFTQERYFFPVQMIQVSPIGLKNFLSERGLRVLISEFQFIWLPCFFILIFSYFSRPKST